MDDDLSPARERQSDAAVLATHWWQSEESSSGVWYEFCLRCGRYKDQCGASEFRGAVACEPTDAGRRPGRGRAGGDVVCVGCARHIRRGGLGLWRDGHGSRTCAYRWLGFGWHRPGGGGARPGAPLPE